MQPLGGKAGRRKEGRKRQQGGFFSKKLSTRSRESSPGILLSTKSSWRRGASQTFGASARMRQLRRLRVPGGWRGAACLFLGVTALYGILVGGSVERFGEFLSSKTTSVVVRAGLGIERLTIQGQNRTSDQEIVRALGLTSHQSMLGFDSAAAQEKLQKLPWVRHAQIMRLLPSRLHIVIVEREPFAIWQHNGETRLVDNEGTVIAPTGLVDYPGLPFVVGVGAAQHARLLFDQLAEKPDLKGRVRAAVRVADRRWNLKLDNDVEIRLPEENVSYAIAKVDELDRRHRLLSGDIASVDLRLPGRVTVRMNSDAQKRRDAAAQRVRATVPASGRDT